MITRKGRLDKRTKASKRLDIILCYIGANAGAIVCSILLGFIAACILVASLLNAPHASPKAPGTPGWNQTTPYTKPQGMGMSKTLVGEVKAVEIPCDYDPITYIRCSGEKLGKSNKVITTMIRIARAESNLRPRAKNANSTASGIFQIIYGTWNSNDCQGNAFNFVNNIDCAWKIQTARGFQPWEVWNKGVVQ